MVRAAHPYGLLSKEPVFLFQQNRGGKLDLLLWIWGTFPMIPLFGGITAMPLKVY